MSAPLVTRFEAFTTEHLALIAGFLVVGVALAAVGAAHRETRDEVLFRRGFALLIPCFTVPMQILQLLPGDYDVGTSLPLQLCDLAWVAAIVALWTRHWSATALVYFWGLTLTVQAIITPSLSELFPDPRYFMFWGMHFFTVWAAVYLTFGLGVRLDWRSFRFAVAVTSIWAVTVMSFNAVTGTNYGYLNRKPAVGTVLDLFGPWPGYVVVEVAVVVGVWALMTWPWVRAARKRQDPPHSSAGRSAAPQV
ncbi:MAG TPA: TIGR02206 family membrane protein [Marmoricola sp.]|nr:TIGR02206 family membrane protein [Marmoricola sp.]